jgi:MFS family permease
MSVLVPFRCVQGVGGGLLLCASLLMFAGTARPGDSPLNGWSAAAAIGVAAGPALGGILTQIFDWRAILLAQAPVAAVAVILVVAVSARASHPARRRSSVARGKQGNQASRPDAALSYVRMPGIDD